MRGPLRIFKGFEAAERADDAYYAALSPEERLEILLALIANHRESLGDPATRLERVYRIVELAES